MAESTTKKGFFARIAGFFRNLKAEIKKINWPTKEQTAKQTLAVVIISILLCLFIRGIDILAQLAVNAMSTLVK